MSLFRIVEKPVFRTRIREEDVKLKEMALGYLFAPFCAMVSAAVFGAYLNRYYVDVLGWTRFGVFTMLLPVFSSALVILGNLMIGRWIDRTRTTQGKARPYLLLSCPMAAVAIILLFMTPSDVPDPFQMAWIAVSYILYHAVAYPCFYTAHSSMVSLSTRNTEQRGLLATLSNASMVAAAGIAGSILAPILLQSYLFVSTAGGLDVKTSYAHWRILSIGLALLTAFGILLEYYFTRERISEETMREETKDAAKEAEIVPARRHMEACTKDRYWWMMILFVLVFQLGQGAKNSSMSFYVRWMFDRVIVSADPEAASGALMSTLGIIGGIPSAVGMLIAWPVARRLGKKRAIVAGLVFALAGGLVCFLDVKNFTTVCVGIILKGIGIIPAQYVILALLSDVLDHLERKNGFRSDGFTMSVYGAVTVGLGGLVTGLLNMLLTFSWYSNSGIPCDPKTMTEIKNVASWTGQIVYRQYGGTESVLAFLYLGLDMITFLISIILLWRMNVEKEEC